MSFSFLQFTIRKYEQEMIYCHLFIIIFLKLLSYPLLFFLVRDIIPFTFKILEDII